MLWINKERFLNTFPAKYLKPKYLVCILQLLVNLTKTTQSFNASFNVCHNMAVEMERAGLLYTERYLTVRISFSLFVRVSLHKGEMLSAYGSDTMAPLLALIICIYNIYSTVKPWSPAYLKCIKCVYGLTQMVQCSIGWEQSLRCVTAKYILMGEWRSPWSSSVMKFREVTLGIWYYNVTSTTISEVNLAAFIYRLFHADFS